MSIGLKGGGGGGGEGVPSPQTLQVCKFFIQLLGVVLKTLIKCQADHGLPIGLYIDNYIM